MNVRHTLLSFLLWTLSGTAHSTPCEDSSYVRIGKAYFKEIPASDKVTYVMKDSLCSAYIDSLEGSDLKNHRVEIRTKKDPTNSYFGLGFGALMMAGGAAIYQAGESGVQACREEDAMIKFCDMHKIFAAPVFGLGALSVTMGIIGLSRTYSDP